MTAAWNTKAEGDSTGRAPDLEETRRALELLIEPASRVELFSIFPARYIWHGGDELAGLLDDVRDNPGSVGNFVAVNPLPADFQGQSGTGAHVPDFSCRRWFVLDVDPVKPAKDVNATDGEHSAARDVMGQAIAFLGGKGAPDPLLIDTGGGWLALYRVELPNDNGSRALLARLLKALGGAFDQPGWPGAVIDPGSARVTFHARLPGTWNRKGPHTPDRPQRMVRLARVPASLDVLPQVLLEELAGPAPARKAAKPFATRATGSGREQAYAQKALFSECAAVASSTEFRNNALNNAALKLGQLVGAGLLDRDEVERALEEAACACGLDTDTPGLRGIRATIKSGLDAGEKKPRGMPEESTSGQAAPSSNGTPPAPEEGPKEEGPAKPPLPPFHLLRGVGLNVARVVQLGKPPRGVFDLVLEDGTIVQLGTTAEVLDPKTARARIADMTRAVLPVLKAQEWGPTAQSIFRAAEMEDVGSDPQAELREWIEQFVLAQAPAPIAPDNKTEIIDTLKTSGVALDEVNVVYLSLPKFQAALLGLSSMRVARSDLIGRLFHDDFRSLQLDVKPDGRQTGAARRKFIRAWISPKGYFASITGDDSVPSVPSEPGGGCASDNP
jgi:hypothetical protein